MADVGGQLPYVSEFLCGDFKSISGGRLRTLIDERLPAEIQLFRQVILGPGPPYIAGGLAMDDPEVGFGQNDAFGYQARGFLEEVAGISKAEQLPRCATFDEGVSNMELLGAVTESALNNGKKITL